MLNNSDVYYGYSKTICMHVNFESAHVQQLIFYSKCVHYHCNVDERVSRKFINTIFYQADDYSLSKQLSPSENQLSKFRSYHSMKIN
jgi:hypothetical protein